MKLLVIARNYKNFVSRQVTYNLIAELAKITDLSVWHDKGTDIEVILNTLQINPDFILILEYYETNATKVTGLSRLAIPFAVSLQDLHWDVNLRKGLLLRENVRHIFTPSKTAFIKYYPELQDRMHWLPHHVNTDMFTDYGLTREIDYLLMGQASSVYYPFRAQVLAAMQGKEGFIYHQHPGYKEILDTEDHYVREKYAREISRAKIFFTCGGKMRYPVAKYFEVLACNTLLLAPYFEELDDLGFIPGVHFVEADEHNFEEKAHYYLNHEQERLKIALRGYEMVRARHSSPQRAAEVLAVIKQIITST